MQLPEEDEEHLHRKIIRSETDKQEFRGIPFSVEVGHLKGTLFSYLVFLFKTVKLVVYSP